LANNVHVSFKGVEGEALVSLLKERGIDCATGSACTSKHIEPSHVVRALGLSFAWLHGCVRFSLGRSTTKNDVLFVVQEVTKAVGVLR
jgi:cysteine desulfurase